MATSIFKKNFPGVEKLQHLVDTADYVIGLDLHKKTTALCIVERKHPSEPVLQRKRLANRDLLSTLVRFVGKKIIVCESAYGWFPLRAALKDLVEVTLVLLDPRKTSSWMASSGIKNDKIDAQVLCYACLHGGIPSLAVHQPSEQARECFKLVHHRDQLVRQRTRILHQLNAIEQDYGSNPFTGEVPEKSSLLLSMEADLHDALFQITQRIRAVEKEIARLSREDAVVARLQTIPGIGLLTAFALRWKIETLDRFADPAHLSSYFGFGIRERQSGEQRIKGHITKAGNALIRTLLIQGAQTIRFRRPEYLPLYFPSMGRAELMRDRQHANKVVTALARKHLTFVFHLWKKGMDFDMDLYRRNKERAAQEAAPLPVASSVAELEFDSARQGATRV